MKVNFGEAQTATTDKNSLEIKRIYVLKEFHGKKIGRLLYKMALDSAEQNKATPIWLEVWEANKRAIRFYKKNGLYSLTPIILN
ncbi:N-acetyltransferase [Cellulophaga sp. L1A9]|uniref:GNAT family N-acetyltransferase n=1 Tax=Cellulophaga sp. L1A9 TaxID=2686362 RepID=UPI001E4D9DE2|nr:GNAT family N-acetyltransferase [Cellulophaga sp. L1A9]